MAVEMRKVEGMSSPKPQKKAVNLNTLLVGAAVNLCDVTTFGQPLEVIKTTMAANRSDSLMQSLRRVWGRGGIFGYYQGLIPWAWIEASTKGAVLLFVVSEVEHVAKSLGSSDAFNGVVAGMAGGVAQAYATMGFCTCMKTVEMTQSKLAAQGVKPPSTFTTFMDIYRKEGIRGINRGVNAVAIRQTTNWGSRFGLTRLVETPIHQASGKREGQALSFSEKVLAASIAGGLSAWNQPIEVIRVEMQSRTKTSKRPKDGTIMNTLKYIYRENGIQGLYRGVTPRVCLGVWQTICMVALGDLARQAVENLSRNED